MERNTLQLVVVAALSAAVAGALGFILGNQYGRAGGRVRPTEPVVAAPVAGGMPAAPAAAGPTMEQLRDISSLEAIVVKSPGDVKAWVALGNLYFDTHQPQKSIDAYARALALQPGDPNVITDQGIMYLALDQYDRAIANFEKANQLDPNHLQSLFNLGIAYRQKGDLASAEKAWQQVIQKAPGSQQAADARQLMQQGAGR